MTDQEDVFAYGDRTILALRTQPSIEQAFDGDATIAIPAARELRETDPITRLEQKLDAALRLIATMQQRLDSIDAALARTINR